MRPPIAVADFVSLEDVLGSIAGRIKKPEEMADYQDLIDAWKYSQAAAALHALFLNYPDQAPRWMTPHEVTRQPIFNDAVAAEGLEILVYLSGWFKRQLAFRGASFPSRSPEDESELATTAHYRKYRWGTLPRSYQMGFDRADVVRFLVSARIAFSSRLGDDQDPLNSTSLKPGGQVGEAIAALGEHLNRSTDESAAPSTVTVPKLTLPEKSDTWAKVIEATYETLVRETGAAPSGLEVWLRLNHKPPTNYPVTATNDRGLPAIALPGERALTRDGFTKRWRRYTGAT